MAWGFKEYAERYGIEYTPLHERDKITADILKGIGTTPAIISAVPPQPMGDFRQLDQDSIAKPFVPVAPQDLPPAKATAVNWDTYKDGGTVATRKANIFDNLGYATDRLKSGVTFGVTDLADKAIEKAFGYEPYEEIEYSKATQNVGAALDFAGGLVSGGALAKALGKTAGKSLMTKAGKVWDAAKGAWVKVPDAAKPVIKTGAKIGAGVTGYETVRGAFDPDYADRRETFPSQFGASVRGGVGDTVSLAGSALEWKGYEEAAKKLKELGTGISEGYESEYVPFTWQAVFNPNWWANNVARTIPTTAALIPAMFLAYKVGAKGAALRGFGKFGQVVIGSLAGSTLSRPLESALEAGAVFEETGDAKKAQEVYDANMKLAALDSAQLALAFAPAPVKGASKFGKATIAASKTKPGKFVRATTKLAGVGVTEGLEEGYQEAVSTRATGEDNRSIIQQILRPTPELAEAMAIGGIFGIGIGGAGVINDVYTEAKSFDNAIRSQVAETLPNQAKLQMLQTIDNYMAEGMNEEEATIHVLELLAETEEGREVIIAATQTVASEYVNNSGDIQQLVLERLAESNPAVLAKAGDKVYDSFTGTELTVTDDSAPDRFTVVNAYGQQGTIMRSDVSFDKPETPKMQAMEQGQAEEGMPIMPSASITDQGTRVYDKNTGKAFTVVLQTSPEFVVVEDSEGGNTIMSVDDLTTGTIEDEITASVPIQEEAPRNLADNAQEQLPEGETLPEGTVVQPEAELTPPVENEAQSSIEASETALKTDNEPAEDFQKGETVLDGEGNLVVVVNSGNEKTMRVKGSDGKARVINKADASRTVESSESTHQSGESVPVGEESKYAVGTQFLNMQEEPEIVIGKYKDGRYLLKNASLYNPNSPDFYNPVFASIVSEEELDHLASRQKEVQQQIVKRKEREAKELETEKAKTDELSIGDFYNDKLPMQKEKAKNTLNKFVSVTTKEGSKRTVRAKQHIAEMVEEGRVFKEEQTVANEQEVLDAQKELDRIKANGWESVVPKSKLRELENIIVSPKTRIEYRAYGVYGDENLFTKINKTEYEYAKWLKEQKQPTEETKPEQVVKPTKESAPKAASTELYHGTNQEGLENIKGGSWFTPNKDMADKFASGRTKQKKGKANTYSVQVDLSNKNLADISKFGIDDYVTPKDIAQELGIPVEEVNNAFLQDIFDENMLDSPTALRYITEMSSFTELLKAKGFDGIKAKEGLNAPDDYVPTYKLFDEVGLKTDSTKESESVSNEEVKVDRSKKKKSSVNFKLDIAGADTNSPEFKAWFGDSKVVDENGEPLVVYHGTGAKINEFKPEFTGQGNDQLGSGFYFSTNKEDAEIYQTKQLPTGESKLGGLDNPNIVSAYLSIQKPITIKGDTLVDSDVSLSQNQAYKILKYSPSIMDKEESPLGDWFEAYYEVGPKEYMVKNVATYYTGKSLLSLENDFFKGESTAFRNALNKVLGYDGVVKEFSNGQKHYVAWFPTQIKSIYNQGTWDATNPDIRFKSDSVTAIAKDLNLTPAPEAMEQEIFQAANTLSQIFTGNDIVTFKGKGIQGMADGDQIYLNQDAKDPVLYVAKHEIVHTLETTDPESYKKLMQLVRRYFNGNQEMVKHYQKQKYTAEEAWGEFTSDVVSEVMEEPGFWKLVRERSPKLIKAVVDIIDQIITKFKKAIAKEDSMLQYINDLESFKAEVAGVVAESLSKPKRRNILDLRTDTQVAAKNKAEKAPSMINLPKRYTPYGVGKDIGGKVYLHKQYENVLPQNLLADAKDKLPKGFEYTGVSYDRKSGQFTFTYSPDFDTAHEPTVGNQIVVKPDGNLLIIKQKDNPQIWHHKWLWVKDDYKGFNVEESKERSRMWSAIPNVDKSRIGYKDFWETNVVPLIEPSSKLHQAISSAGTSLHQIAATFKSRWFTPGKLNIDIGGGKYDKGSEFLKETYGTENLIYDPYNRTPGYNKMIMDRLIAGERGDTVTVNNVLNVIAESDVRANVILQAAKAVKDNGNVFFAIYEGSGTGIGSTTPRGWQNNSRAEYYVDAVKKYFGTVERKGSLIIASNPKNISQPAIWELGNDTRIKFKRNLLDGIGTTKNVNETEAKYKFGRPQIEPQEFIGPLKGVVIEANRVHRAEVAATGLRTERWKETLSEEQLQDLGAFIEKVENLKSEKDFATIAKEINADPEMKKVLQEYMVTQESMRRKINDYLRDVTDEDYIKFVENYIPHFYINEPGTSKKVSTDKVGKWIRNSPNAKQRKIPTLKEARDLGLVPLTQNIAELQNKWANINWLVATNRKLLSSVKEFTNADGENIIMKANNAPTDWIRVKHPAFARIYARKTESGQTVLYEGEVAVDPEAYKILRQVIEEPLSGGVINAIESFNAYAKKAQLSFSLFHHWALTESAIGALGVKGLILVGKDTQGLGKGIITQPHRVGKKLMEQEDFLRDAIMHGLTLESVSDAHVGKVKSGLVSLERKTEGKLFVGKTAEKARQFNDAWDKTLWTNYHNGLKAYTYYAFTEKYISQLPSNATAADISGVKEKIAETINDMYGGQEWASKFWLSPQARQMWQMLQLAPDWTLSNANVAAKAITKAKDPVMGPILRKYWSNMLLSQALIISAMCFAFSGHFPWDNEEGHKTEIEVTAITRRLNKLFGKHEKNPDQRYYMHPGKQIREVVGWVTDPLLTVRRKASPAVHTVIEQISGHSTTGWEMPWTENGVEKNFWSSLPQRTVAAAEKFVPFSIGGLASQTQFAFTFPMRKGMTPWKAVRAYEDVIRMNVDPTFAQKAYKIPAAKAKKAITGQSLLGRLDEACVTNGLDPDKMYRDARSKVVSQYYGEMWGAINHDNMRKADKAAQVLLELDVTASGLKSSAKARGLSEEDYIKAIEVMRRNAGKR